MAKLFHYIDLEKTTIAILKDYLDQEWKLENDPKRLREIDAGLRAPNSALYDLPVQGGAIGEEEKWCAALDKKSLISYGYQQAREYLSEFMPAWERLSKEEQNLLRIRYIDHLEPRAIERVMREHHISKSEAYNRLNTALSRLTKLLFW